MKTKLATFLTAKNSDKHWERFGQIDPYFGVIDWEQFRAENLGADSLEEFFQTGREQVQIMMETIHTHLDPDFRPVRALEFGCGVGRMLIPVASIAESVVGMDISDSMLEEAAKHCTRYGTGNVELLKSDDDLSQVSGQFDLIYSHIVFQHLAAKRGKAIAAKLLSLLREDGIAVLHFTYDSLTPKLSRAAAWIFKYVPLASNAYNLLLGRGFSYPQMQTNFYDLNHIFSMLQKLGCHQSYVRFTTHGRNLGVVIFTQKVRPSTL